MDDYLAAMYGTNGATDEDTEKVAQAELFAKLAADNGIDLNDLSDDQIGQLWTETFDKVAEEDGKCPDCGKADCSCESGESGDEKKEAAAQEFFEKKAYQEKLAEADYMGRVMAHAYVNELNAIGEGLDKEGSKLDNLKGYGKKGVEKAKEYGGKARDAASRYVGGGHLKDVKNSLRQAEGAIGKAKRTRMSGPAAEHAKRQLGGIKKELKSERAKVWGTRAALGTAGAGAAAAGAASMRKKSSAIDELAAEMALHKAAEAGWDVDEACEVLESALTLGVSETEKTASASSLDEAVDIRSLEFLEAVGYPVTWND